MSFLTCDAISAVYFAVPKSGCTSFKNWFYLLEYGRLPKNPVEIHKIEKTELVHIATNREAIERKFQSSFVFTFVRHPLRRAYSFYTDKLSGADKRTFAKLIDFLEKEYGADFKEQSIEKTRENFLLFLRFVEAVYKRGEHSDWQNWHHAPQTRIIRSANKVRPLDFVGRMESLDTDFAYVQSKVGATAPLPHLNVSERHPVTFDEVLTDDIKEVGRRAYAADLRSFAYEI